MSKILSYSLLLALVAQVTVLDAMCCRRVRQARENITGEMLLNKQASAFLDAKDSGVMALSFGVTAGLAAHLGSPGAVIICGILGGVNGIVSGALLIK